METSPPEDTRGFNPVFWLMWLLPGSTVVAGFVTLAVAIQGADRPLPVEYHWEGARLDADFDRARHAAELGLTITFSIRDGQCNAVVVNAPDEPAALNLLLTHGSDPGFDRRIRMQPVSQGGYRAACEPLAAGKWRLAFDDDSAKWALRGVAEGSTAHLEVKLGPHGRGSP